MVLFLHPQTWVVEIVLLSDDDKRALQILMSSNGYIFSGVFAHIDFGDFVFVHEKYKHVQ